MRSLFRRCGNNYWHHCITSAKIPTLLFLRSFHRARMTTINSHLNWPSSSPHSSRTTTTSYQSVSQPSTSLFTRLSAPESRLSGGGDGCGWGGEAEGILVREQWTAMRGMWVDVASFAFFSYRPFTLITSRLNNVFTKSDICASSLARRIIGLA